jgi:hypothetical protein
MAEKMNAPTETCTIGPEVNTVAAIKDLSVEELRSLIGEVVEEKLQELLGDPDEGLEVRPEIRERLLNSLSQVPHETSPASEVARSLGLEW